jgi:hypothetical protein
MEKFNTGVEYFNHMEFDKYNFTDEEKNAICEYYEYFHGEDDTGLNIEPITKEYFDDIILPGEEAELYLKQYRENCRNSKDEQVVYNNSVCTMTERILLDNKKKLKVKISV